MLLCVRCHVVHAVLLCVRCDYVQATGHDNYCKQSVSRLGLCSHACTRCLRAVAGLEWPARASRPVLHVATRSSLVLGATALPRPALGAFGLARLHSVHMSAVVRYVLAILRHVAKIIHLEFWRVCQTPKPRPWPSDFA